MDLTQGHPLCSKKGNGNGNTSQNNNELKGNRCHMPMFIWTQFLLVSHICYIDELFKSDVPNND